MRKSPTSTKNRRTSQTRGRPGKTLEQARETITKLEDALKREGNEIAKQEIRWADAVSHYPFILPVQKPQSRKHQHFAGRLPDQNFVADLSTDEVRCPDICRDAPPFPR